MNLEIDKLTVLYDKAMILDKVCLRVAEGEFVSLVGPNGAGKTTLLRSIAGLVQWEKDVLKGTKAGRITMDGHIKLDGNDIINLPAYQIAKLGLILCPERGRPYPNMKVIDNLKTGAFLYKDKKVVLGNLDRVYHLFPVLKAREKQLAGTLSGGERTMLAIGRALMSQAKLLLIDEPSVGLAPKLKDDLFARIRDIRNFGITILMTEQDIGFAFDLAGRNYVMSRGHIIAEGAASHLLQDELIRKTYLGL